MNNNNYFFIKDFLYFLEKVKIFIYEISFQVKSDLHMANTLYLKKYK